NFVALHKELTVRAGDNIAFINGLREARPTCTRIILVERAEKRFACDNIYVNAIVMVIPILIAEGRFGAFVLGNLVLRWRQFLTQLIIARLLIFFSHNLFS